MNRETGGGGVHSSGPGWRWQCGVTAKMMEMKGLESRHAVKEKMTDVILSLDKDEGIKAGAWIVDRATGKW